MDETNFERLPRAEKWEVWNIIEQNFWKSFKVTAEDQQKEAEQDHELALTFVATDTKCLDKKHRQLHENRECLLRQLRDNEQELAEVETKKNEQAQRMNELETEFKKEVSDRIAKQKDIATKMETYFSDFRIQHNLLQIQDASREEAELVEASQCEAEPTPQSSSPKEAVHPLPPPSAVEAVANITDASGLLIGLLKLREPLNRWSKAISELSIQRPIKIRRGRPFTQDHLAAIYEPSDPKGAKWIGCMIQATGEIQERRCHTCTKSHGPFDDCIIVGGPFFPKCGNCEWSRRGCHGHARTKEAEESGDGGLIVKDETQDRVSPPEASKSSEDVEDDGGKDAQEAVAATAVYQCNTRRSLALRQPTSTSTSISETTSTAATASTAQPVEASFSSTVPEKDADLKPINQETLVLKHNGTVYTYPDIVAGVPLEKIDKNHPYWDPNWPDIKSLIEPQYAQWKGKHDAVMHALATGDEAVQKARFKLGQQTNRGAEILEYLRRADHSPYQLLSKKFIFTGKGSIVSYDILYRLCATLKQLEDFGLDVRPVDWVRHRLYELWVEQGASFNVLRVIRGFYHDAKLRALRTQAGKKSVGRSLGYKLNLNGKDPSPGGSDSPQHQAKKRKRISAVQSSSSLCQLAEPSSESRARKRPKHASFLTRPIFTESEDEYYSETDSWSGAPIGENDFRVYQIKSRLYTSSNHVTQYLYWVDYEQTFEHQVLKEVNPVSWGVHKQPIDFDIYYNDVVEVIWNADSLHVYLAMREDSEHISEKDGLPRGDVMVAFKRETTLHRFIDLCQKLNLKIVNQAKAVLEERWTQMQSESLPESDQESSDDLKVELSPPEI